MAFGGGALSHRFAFKTELVRAVHKSIQNGVGKRRIADVVVPVIDRKLAGDQCGASADAVIEQFEQIRALTRTHGRDREVVDDQQAGLGDGGQPFGETAVGVTQVKFFEEPGRPHVERGEPFPAGMPGWPTHTPGRSYRIR